MHLIETKIFHFSNVQVVIFHTTIIDVCEYRSNLYCKISANDIKSDNPYEIVNQYFSDGKFLKRTIE